MDFIAQLDNCGIRIKTVNIGGGLSSSYTHPEEPPEFTFQKYREVLEASVPRLFSGKYEVRCKLPSVSMIGYLTITDFGRSDSLKYFVQAAKEGLRVLIIQTVIFFSAKKYGVLQDTI